MNGDVKMKLDGNDVVLKCSLGAAIKIDEEFGGFAEAYRQVGSGRLSALTSIIAVGLGVEADDVRDKVYRTGVTNVMRDALIYVTTLGNGGRGPDEAKEAAKTGEG